MKTILISTLLLITIVVTKITAQDFYYYKNEKIPLTIGGKKILVKFSDQLSTQQKRQVLLNYPWIKPYNDSMSFKHDESLALSDLNEGVNISDIKNIVKKMTLDPAISYSNVVYSTANGGSLSSNNTIIVKLKQGVLYSDLENLVTKNKCKISKKDNYTSSIYYISVAKNSTGDALTLANIFYETGLFEFAEPDFIVSIKRNSVNDPDFPTEWQLQNTGQLGIGTPGADINALPAWNITTGSEAIKIAIIDEGVDLVHPDLIANLVPGYDATGLGSNGACQGNDAHGTNCAGLAAARGNNGIGVAGVAYSSKIVPVRIYYNNSSGLLVISLAQMADGINWAWHYGQADVLSNSWQLIDSPSSAVEQAIQNAVEYGRGGLGSVVVFSAGNDNSSSIGYPANQPSVIAVGAMGFCNQRISPSSCGGPSWGSNYGTGLSVIAPGVNLTTTDISGRAGYTTGNYNTGFSGTSGAAPIVAGVMALILSMNPCLNYVQARAMLESKAVKIGGYSYSVNNVNGSWNNEVGYGRVNAYESVSAAVNFGTDLYLQNATLSTSQVYNRRNIFAGNNVLSTATAGNFIVASGGNLIVNGFSMSLQPGFSAVVGSKMSLNTTTTEPEPCLPLYTKRVATIDFDNSISSFGDNSTTQVAETNTDVVIYPNPFLGKFKLDIPLEATSVQVCIDDMKGTRVYESTLSSSQEIDLSGQEAGIYILRTKIDGAIKNKKITLYK